MKQLNSPDCPEHKLAGCVVSIVLGGRDGLVALIEVEPFPEPREGRTVLEALYCRSGDASPRRPRFRRLLEAIAPVTPLTQCYRQCTVEKSAHGLIQQRLGRRPSVLDLYGLSVAGPPSPR